MLTRWVYFFNINNHNIAIESLKKYEISLEVKGRNPAVPEVLLKVKDR